MKKQVQNSIHAPAGDSIRFPQGTEYVSRQKMLASLSELGLIEYKSGDWLFTETTCEAFKATASSRSDNRTEFQRQFKEQSKRAFILDMLLRPEGATIHDISEAVGWTPDTVRSLLRLTFQKKLGIVISTRKGVGRARTYHVGA
jgi:hypothetical protein